MSKLPSFYQWLERVDQPPRIIWEALKLFGTHETPGPRSNPTIMGWKAEAQAAGLSMAGYASDATAWCGLFAAIVVLRAGKRPPDAPLWALNWRQFGLPVLQPGLGDVLVYKREGGGHVNFYVGEDHDCYHGIGGNQSDQVSFTRIEKARCVAKRSPAYSVRPASAVPRHLAASGAISTSEA